MDIEQIVKNYKITKDEKYFNELYHDKRIAAIRYKLLINYSGLYDNCTINELYDLSIIKSICWYDSKKSKNMSFLNFLRLISKQMINLYYYKTGANILSHEVAIEDMVRSDEDGKNDYSIRDEIELNVVSDTSAEKIALDNITVKNLQSIIDNRLSKLSDRDKLIMQKYFAGKNGKEINRELEITSAQSVILKNRIKIIERIRILYPDIYYKYKDYPSNNINLNNRRKVK